MKLQLASEYAGVANYWKFYDGETKQLLKYDIAGQKKRTEDAFTAWAKGKPKYENVMSDFAKIYDAWRPYAMHRQYILEGITGCLLIQTSGGLLQLEGLLMREDNPPIRSNAPWMDWKTPASATATISTSKQNKRSSPTSC